MPGELRARGSDGGRRAYTVSHQIRPHGDIEILILKRALALGYGKKLDWTVTSDATAHFEFAVLPSA